MKKLTRTLLISIIALVVLGGTGYYLVQKIAADGGNRISNIAEDLEQREADKAEAATTKEGQESKGGKQADIGMDEGHLQTYIHQMTHQKVVADKKFGKVEMSEENIRNLLKIVQLNYDDYEHSKFYESTLMAWEKGDFSNAVGVHNRIWDWHHGTVGRATDLMTPEQEAEYVEKHFR